MDFPPNFLVGTPYIYLKSPFVVHEHLGYLTFHLSRDLGTPFW